MDENCHANHDETRREEPQEHHAPGESDHPHEDVSGEPAEAEGKLLAVVLAEAVETELQTGTREPDTALAKAHLLVRLARGIAGALTVVAGIALTVLPGPGVLLILAGLGILAIDYPFAARLRDRLLSTGSTFAGRAGGLLKRFLLGIGVAALLAVVLLAALVVLVVRALG